jgi:hypothetical protein
MQVRVLFLSMQETNFVIVIPLKFKKSPIALFCKAYICVSHVEGHVLCLLHKLEYFSGSILSLFFNFIVGYNSQRSWLLMCLYNYNYYFSSYKVISHNAKSHDDGTCKCGP